MIYQVCTFLAHGRVTCNDLRLGSKKTWMYTLDWQEQEAADLNAISVTLTRWYHGTFRHWYSWSNHHYRSSSILYPGKQAVYVSLALEPSI